MKKFIVPIGFAAMLCLSLPARAQSLKDIINAAKGNNTSSGNNNNSNAGNNGSNSGLGSGLSNSDIAGGLKEALTIGAKNAANRLSLTDGFFKNAAIKILLPKEAQQVEKTLRSIGMGSVVDKAILSMNRAAEDAAKQAAPIFVNAITSITIQDGLNILRGGNNAATTYLKGKTTAALTTAFTP